MATFYQWLAQTTTAVGHYFRPALVRTGNIVNFADATTTSTSETAPWTVTLVHQATDLFGDALYPASTVATYTVPATDPQSKATFDFSYVSLELASNLSAVLWTQPVGTYAPLDLTALHMQRYDDAGNKVGTETTLKLLGTQTDVKNLYDIGYSSGPDFGNSFMVAYSTFDPVSKATQIKYERFSDAGAPLTGGVLYSINDGSRHGIDFAAYFTASGPYTPAYMLLHRLPQGATGAIHVHTMLVDGTPGPFDFDLPVRGPNGENSIAVDNFNFDRPNTADPNGDYGVLSETFRYRDASNVVHEAIGLQTLGPTGTILARTTFEVGVGETATVRIAHVGHGAFVIGYSDGSNSYVKQFDGSLTQIGTTLALPDSSGDITSLVSLGDGRFQVMWRQYLPDVSHSVLHSAIYDTRTAGVSIDQSGATTAQQIAGTVFNDTLTGGQAADKIVGNAGNDVINGGSGADRMLGGTGDDTYVVDNAGDGVTENAGEGTDTVKSSITYTLGDNVENLTLTGAANLNGTGNALVNTLIGTSGNNILDGQAGADVMRGGAGNDTYVVDNAGDVAFEAAGEGTDTVKSSVTYTLGGNVENLTLTGAANLNGNGNALDNTLIGNAGNNILDGKAGVDIMRGGAGNDTYIVDNAGDVAFEAAGEGTDIVKSSVSYTLGGNVENLTLTGAANLNGNGNALDNTLIGNAGNNILDGKAGADIMRGGAGNDTYIVDNAGDVSFEAAGEGTDTVKSSLTYTLGGNVENLTLTGATNINGTGNTLDNVITGNAGNNILDGKAGADTLRGGAGDDTYIVDNVGDVAFEVAGQGTDTVKSSVTYTLAANVENLTLTGAAGIGGTGNTLDNVITGNSGNNIINGGRGNDLLIGGGGGDTFLFNSPLAANIDTVADFAAANDKIQLDQTVFTALATLGTLSAAAFFVGAAAHDADDRIVYNSATGGLLYDRDGTGAAAAVQFATLTGTPAITQANFTVVA